MGDLIKRLKATAETGVTPELIDETVTYITELRTGAKRSQEAYRVIFDERKQLGEKCVELEKGIQYQIRHGWTVNGIKAELRALIGDEE